MSKEKALRRLVLASASPRRLQLLRMIGYEPVVRVSDIPEVRGEEEGPADYVRRLSREKALAVSCADDEVVLAADTTVAARDEQGVTVLEKPESEEDAARMLGILAGRTHEVWTGFSIRFEGELITACEKTLVEFGEISEDERWAYVRSGEPMGKAGAYAIQGLAAKYVTRIEGCYPNVVGLPVAAVYKELRRLPFGIKV